MRIESHAELLVEEVAEAFILARNDVLEEARHNAAKYSKTGKFERSLEATDVEADADALTARVGSPLASAAAKERGAYVTPKRKPWLVFMGQEGHLVKVAAVRLPRRPAVVPAGRRFPEFMLERLREIRSR